MKVKVEIEIPDDFYIATLTYTELVEAVRSRMEDAIQNEWPFARSLVKINEIKITNRFWSVLGPCPYCGEKDTTKFVKQDKEITGYPEDRYGCGTCNVWWNAPNRDTMGPQRL